jgi:hypothetical protein
MTRLRGGTVLIVSMSVAGCGKGDSEQTCTYNGKTYPSGVTWPSTDGCHECWCNASPEAVCDSGPSCDAGVSGVETCNTCECLWRWAHNEVACTLRACSDSSGGNALPGGEASAGSCAYNGKTYPLDVYFESADGCDTCHCRPDGQVTCTFQHTKCLEDAGLSSGAVDAATGFSIDATACTWSASLNERDASDGRCVAARTYLTCTNANCLSDDLSRCLGPLPAPEGTCQNQCLSSEYGVQCGTVGPSTFEVPEGCRLITALPAGIGF